MFGIFAVEFSKEDEVDEVLRILLTGTDCARKPVVDGKKKSSPLTTTGLIGF